MKKQIKKFVQLFSLAALVLIIFGVSNVKAASNKSIKVSKTIYESLIYRSDDLTEQDKIEIKNQYDESTHTIVMSDELIKKVKEITIVDNDYSWLYAYTMGDKGDVTGQSITISKDVLLGIENFVNVEDLHVAINSFQEIDLSYISKLTNLRKLYIGQGESGTLEQATYMISICNLSLADCKKLEDVYINAVVSNIDFSMFKNMEGLKRLRISTYANGAEQMRVAMNKEKCTISNLSEISNLRNLENLGVSGVVLTNEDINFISTLSKSSKLYLSNNNVEVISENNEYSLPELFIKEVSSGAKLVVDSGTISSDGKKVVFPNNAKKGDKIVVKTSGNSYVLAGSQIIITYNPNTYKYLEGESQTYTMNSGKGLTFRIDANYALFKNGGKVFVNTKEVESKYITSKEGSTIITLAEEFLKTLKAGKNEIKVIFSNGVESKADFIVAEQKKETNTNINNQTNTNNNTNNNTTNNTSSVNTNKPVDYKANPDTGRIFLTYVDLSILNINI